MQGAKGGYCSVLSKLVIEGDFEIVQGSGGEYVYGLFESRLL